MEDFLADIKFEKPLLLVDLMAWMDGGSVTLKLLDCGATEFSVEFCQTMYLQKHPYANTPGSFLFNGREVPIRSGSENVLLEALRNTRFEEIMPAEEQTATRLWIQELTEFVESKEYLRIANLMGRLPN